jgi:hypothetical protein
MAKGRPSGLQGLATMNEAGKVIFRMAYSHVEAQGDETKGNPLPGTAKICVILRDKPQSE